MSKSIEDRDIALRSCPGGRSDPPSWFHPLAELLAMASIPTDNEASHRNAIRRA
jgi:hypothetical protein